MTLTYVGSLLVIAILSLIIHGVLDRVIDQRSQTGKVVNVSGQQRMLSQRTSMFTVQYLSTGSLEAKAIATGAADQLIKNHEFLLRYHTRQGREMSAPLDALYFDAASNIDDQVNEFVTEVNRLLSEAPFESERTGEIYDLTFFQMAQDKLLFDFNAIVQQYEDESASRISELQLVQRIVLFIVILTLIIEALFVFRPMVRKISSFAQRLQHDANFDSLSGVFNRRAFDQLANRAFKLASRHKHSFSVVVADIDFFKRVNDTFVHAAGDQVIKLAGQLLASNCRDTDVVARVGGEEFTIILPNTPLESAENVAHKLKQKFEDTTSEPDKSPVKMTMSFGVSSINESDSAVEDILARADRGLYAAKEGGRNRVEVVASDEQTSTSGNDQGKLIDS